jgi:hypothetical protein
LRIISLLANASAYLVKPRRHAVLLKLVEQRPCVLEVRLGEPAINRSSKLRALCRCLDGISTARSWSFVYQRKTGGFTGGC